MDIDRDYTVEIRINVKAFSGDNAIAKAKAFIADPTADFYVTAVWDEHWDEDDELH